MSGAGRGGEGRGGAWRAVGRGGLVLNGVLAVAGGLAARAALRGIDASPRAETLKRTNFRGRPVTLAGGPALAAAASLSAALGAVVAREARGPCGARGARGARQARGTREARGARTASLPVAAAALAAGLGSGAVGLYDDVVGAGAGHQDKGFRGHLGALWHGRVTTGLVKVAGVGAAGLAASALLATRPGRPTSSRTTLNVVNVLLGAGVIAGTANLVNLLDLRPGRALKAGLVLGAPLIPGPAGGLVAGPAGAAAALLPDDLGERIMVGDAGANALGAVLGVAMAARTGPLGRAALLAGIASLTAASERVSFTEVIARTPGLRELDALGRRPA